LTPLQPIHIRSEFGEGIGKLDMIKKSTPLKTDPTFVNLEAYLSFDKVIF